MAPLQTSLKGSHRLLGRPLEFLLLDRVVRNQIHMALKPSQQLGQGLGVVGAVVETAQQDVLKTDPTARDGHVAAAILEQRLQGVGMGRRDELLTQPLVGGMQAHGQGELGAPQPLQGPFGQGGQGLGYANRADRDLPLGHAQIRAKAVDRCEHRIDVEQGLTHAHEHHMARALIHHLAHAQHLVHDLVHRQRALQAPLTRGTKAASHRAAHLAADANGQPIGSRDTHGFEGEAIGRTQQQLGCAITGHAAVQFAGTAYPIAAALGGLGLELGAPILRQNGNRFQAAGPFGVQPIVELAATKGRLALGLGPLLQRRKAHPQQGTGPGWGAHQTRRPCPRYPSTARRAMNPSMAIRPLKSSVWVWKP